MNDYVASKLEVNTGHVHCAVHQIICILASLKLAYMQLNVAAARPGVQHRPAGGVGRGAPLGPKGTI